jgi:predicted nucleic acid-binding protein
VNGSLPKAILDACILFRAALRDTLLRAAEKGIYEVYWSDKILEEVNRNLIKTDKMDEQQVQRLLSAMRRFFPSATVKGFESLIPEMKNDPKDRHVLAAAVMAEAEIIVTSNLQDFPKSALSTYDIEALSPDEFLIYLFNQNPEIMTQIIIEQAAQMRRPPTTVTDVLNALAVDAPSFVEMVRSLS